MAHTKQRAKRYRTLREWRQAKGLTQREAAAFLGVSAIGYQKYEHGLRHPRPVFLKRIVALTGVSVDVLAGAA